MNLRLDIYEAVIRGLVPRIPMGRALCPMIGMAGTSPAMTVEVETST